MDASPDLIDEVQRLEEELAKVKRKNELLDRDNKDFLSKLETAGKWGQRLLEENQDLKRNLKESAHLDIQDLREEFKENLRAMEAEVIKLERENEALKAGGGGGGGGGGQAVFDRPKLQRGMSEALRANDEMAARIDELEAENRHLQHKVEQARDQLEEMERSGGSGKPFFDPGNVDKGFSAKGAFQTAFGFIQRDRLHKKLEDEGTRADELEMQLRTMQDATKKAAETEAKLKQEFQDIQKFAQQQRALKYGAQAQLQDFEMKNDNLAAELLRMQNRLKGLEDMPSSSGGHNEKIQVLKGAAPALNSLYADLKAGVDDIAWLTTEDSDDDSEDGESDSSSEPGDPSMYSRYLKTKGEEAPDGDVPLPHGATTDSAEVQVGEDDGKPSTSKSAYKGGKSAYSGGKIPSAYDTMSKRERKVVKMTINETHKKMLAAFRLIEVLQQHVAKLTEELEYLEGVAGMAKKINWYMGIGFVGLSTLVIVLFAWMMLSCGSS